MLFEHGKIIHTGLLFSREEPLGNESENMASGPRAAHLVTLCDSLLSVPGSPSVKRC